MNSYISVGSVFLHPLPLPTFPCCCRLDHDGRTEVLASLMSSIFPEDFSDPGDTIIASPPFGSQIITVGNRYFGLRALALSCTFCVCVEGGGAVLGQNRVFLR